jgi:uncharacterized protein (DUF1697 family)
MRTFVALLRGINVGKAKRLPMADLRELLTRLGHTKVKTLLNSGNAVFDGAEPSSSKNAKILEKAIVETFGFEVPVVVKSLTELDQIVTASPFQGDAEEAKRQVVTFAQDSATLSSLKSLEPLLQPPETLLVGKHAAYLHCANGILESKAGAALVGKVGKEVTTRNWATTQKLLALAKSDA